MVNFPHMVYFDKEREQWVGTDPKLGDVEILADTEEEAEVDLKLLIAQSTRLSTDKSS